MSGPQSRPAVRGDSAATRDRILDAAATIMRRDGLVRATTKEIARIAGCSEALLYKHFPDKRDIFLHVLTERSPRLGFAAHLPGTAAVLDNVTNLVTDLLGFYEQSFPIAVSIFSSQELLAAHRQAMDARGAGPRAPARMLASYLDQEVRLGRLKAADTDALARLLTGAALHEAFLAAYTGEPIDDPGGLAGRLVAVLAIDS